MTYTTAEESGKNWTLKLGDSCERLAELGEDSVDLSVYSPPFASLFTYSPSLRDLGNASTRDEFIEHYGFIIREVLRVTKPGRISCVHVQQLTSTKTCHGIIGLTDFRGQVIQAHDLSRRSNREQRPTSSGHPHEGSSPHVRDKESRLIHDQTRTSGLFADVPQAWG